MKGLLLLLFGTIAWSSAKDHIWADARLVSLDRIWALEPVHSAYQHRLDGLSLVDLEAKDQVKGKTKKLLVTHWYEDSSITKGAPGDRQLFCRFIHSFLYGRHRVRSESKELPPEVAFRDLPEIGAIQFQFMAVVYRNRPTSPSWDRLPSDPSKPVDKNATLRVLWTRDELVIPYLSMEINREQWRSLARVLQGRPLYSFSAFYREACDSVARILPAPRSDFEALDLAYDRN